MASRNEAKTVAKPMSGTLVAGSMMIWFHFKAVYDKQTELKSREREEQRCSTHAGRLAT